ncbi:MAG: DUF1583 domain-containing protein, partial [Pirellulaceae bacterium]|nr:DUF1583 domain-containing protein [Pirellulaceae bacterium]
AAQYGWQLFELHDQPEQRLVTLQRLLPWHTTMGTLDQLDKLLDSVWRRRDLVHEYRVWQCLMAIQRSQHEKAETLLLALSKRPATRAFALEQLIKLADVRGQSDRRLEWRLQLLAVDPQTINFQELAECLISAKNSQRDEAVLSRTLLGLKSPQRLALLDEVLHKGEFSLVLDLIAAFPPEERAAWPVAIRQLHATSSIQWTTSDASQPAQWERVCHQLSAQSFGLSATTNETQLIETVLDGRVIVQNYLFERLLQREGFPLTTAFHIAAGRCQSPVHAYQLALAIELDHVLEASQRRSLLQRHRELALAQSDAREAATRLFCLTLVSAWELELPKAKVPGSSARVPMPGRRPSNQPQNPQQLSNQQQAQAALLRKQMQRVRQTSVGPQLVQRLQAISRSLEPVVLEMQDVANRGDGLAALLSFWIEAGKENSQRFQGTGALPTAAREMAMRHWRCLGSYARYAPLEVVCELVVAQYGCGQSDSGREIFGSLCQVLDSEEAFRQLLSVALSVQDESLTDTLVKSAFDRKFEISSLVGNALTSRALSKLAPESVLHLLDRSWHSEVVSGKRQLKMLTLLNDQATPEWMIRLPVSTLRFQATNLFTHHDLGAMRALISQSRTTDARLRLLTEIRRLGDQPADSDLQLTRRLAGCALHELLEQDTQADQFLDQSLPQASRGPAGWLRALWLDTLGKRDAAISELVAVLSAGKSKSTSGHVAVDAQASERLAVLLLEWSIASHNPSARIAAIEHLKASTADLTPYTPLIATLLDKNLLAECELLLDDFSVFVPPSYLPSYEVYRKVVAKDERLLPQNDAWPSIRQDLERSLLLIELMSKQLAAGDIDTGFRLAKRILSSAQRAAEYAEVNTDEALLRLFQSQIHDRSLRLSFLIGVGKQLLVTGSSAERLQMACMLRREGEGTLSQSLMDLVDNHELSSAQLMKRAIYEMDCDQVDQAVVTVIQALDGHPELMDATIGQFPIQIEMVGVQLANALQQHPALAAAVGDETLQKLLPHIENALPQFESLLLMWAKNPNHQRFDLIQLMWEKLTDEPELARAVLEQMLQAGGINELLLLQALEPPRVNRSRLPGTAPQAPRMPTTVLFYPRFRPPTLERFQSQLIEICQRRPDDFVCQLFLLMHAIQTKQHTLVSQQVTRLAALPLVERSADVARARLLKLVANPRISTSGSGVPGAGTSDLDAAVLGTHGNQGIHGAAAGLQSVEATALLEVALNYALPHDQSLTDSVRDMLMLQYAMQGEAEKLLEQLQMKLPPVLTSNHRSLLSDSQVATTLRNSSVQTITTYSAIVPRQVVLAMQHPKLTWARSLLLTRAAQLEQQPKRQSSIYTAWRPTDMAVRESLVRLDNELIDQYFVLASEALMRADWHPNQMTAWHKSVLPMLVHVAPWELESVSLLDTIWPRNLADSVDQLPADQLPADKLLADQLPADLLAQLRERLHGQITDVGTLGRWQTLGWCHLAMRLGDEDLSNALLDRLLMLANQKLPGQTTTSPTVISPTVPSPTVPNSTVTSQAITSQTLTSGAVAITPETQWRLALWTVATLPSDVVGLDAKRFQLAEVARNAAQSSRNLRLASAIGLTQLAWIDQASPELANALQVALNMQLDESLSLNNVEFASNWSKRAQIDSGMAVVKSLVKSRQFALAIDTLERLVSSQHVAARAQGFLGIMPRANLTSQLLDKPYDLADEVRAMVDSGIEPRRLQLLLEKALVARLSVKGMPAGQLGPWVEPRPFKLPTDNQPPEAAILPTNLISELLRLAISNHELAELKRRATQAAEAGAANTSVLSLLCLIAVHESDLPEAVNRYEQLLMQNAHSESEFARQLREQNGIRAMFELDADIARLSIVNALHKQPLEPYALKFSLLVLNDPTKQRQCDHWSNLLMRQLSLAIDQPTTSELFQLCDWLRSPAFELRTTLRDRQLLRSQLALTYLEKGYVDHSIWAYGRLIDAQTPISPLEEDAYRIELFRVLPTLPAAEQAAILKRCFLNSAANQFPWLTHDLTPEVEPVAARFDGQAQGRGLINQAAITQRKTISLATWIVDVARQHTQQQAVLDVLESQRIHWTTMGQAWGAAVIAIQLDESLTPAELSQWLSESRQASDMPVMHALLEACQTQTAQNQAAQNQAAQNLAAQNLAALRAVVTERVFNLGHLDIVSAATAQPAPLNLKHWLAVNEPQPPKQATSGPTSEPKAVQEREPAHSQAGINAARPNVSTSSSHMPTQRGRHVWSLNEENEVTALPSRTASYLILRYPLAEGCEFTVNAEQVSGEKFGIGYGGLTVAQHANPGRARYLGTNARSFNAEAEEFSLDQPNAALKVTIGPNSCQLEYPGGRLEETIVPSSSILYLFNQGPGTARYREFKLSHTAQNELQFLPQMQLFDPQLRLWRDMLGGTSLPKLWLSNDDPRQTLDQPGSTTCQVNDGVLSFRGPLDSAVNSAMPPDFSAIEFLRPLVAEESVEYEFYHTAGSASVVPVLGRLAFRLHATSASLQWLTTPEERTWLSIKSTGQVELDPQERLADPALQANAWNKVRVLREANSQVLVELNGQPIVRTELPPRAVYQFGLMYCPDSQSQAAQGQPIQPGLVRRGTLTGPWLPKLSSHQLMERD